MVIVVLLLSGAVARAQSQCPQGSPGTTAAPSGNVKVTILSVKPNSDLEDDDIPYVFDDHADIKGTVTIDGHAFKLPEVSDSDFPHWTEGNSFVAHVEGGTIPISIEVGDADPVEDDAVDINPAANKDRLDLQLDTCSLMVTSVDGGQWPGSGDIVISGGGDDSDATITFRVEMEDGRPITGDDVALVGFDLIQVLPEGDTLVAGKPLVALVRVANNAPVPVSVDVQLLINVSGGAVLHNATHSLGAPLQPGEVRKQYLLADTPLVPPSSAAGEYQLIARADLIHTFPEPTGQTSPLCNTINNSSGRQTWHIVNTRRLSLLWMRVGLPLDLDALASMTQLETIRDLGMPYIRAVYPVVAPVSDTSSLPLIPPHVAVLEIYSAIAAALGVPADAVLPFAFVFELNGAAVLAGRDRLMGVLPHEWFGRFLYDLWDGVTGLSLGRFAPRAVIFQASSKHGNNYGPSLALPAHELGHTFGLSMDPTIKNFWACSTPGPIGVLLCGAFKGFDEYVSADHPNGVPTAGYWVPQGGEPASFVAADMLREQCDTSCLMGGSPINAEQLWKSPPPVGGARGRWIDGADYAELVTQLRTGGNDSLLSWVSRTVDLLHGLPAPEQQIYLSGIIGADDKSYFGPSYRLLDARGSVDFARNEANDVYAIRFLASGGAQLGQVTLPPDWNHADVRGKLPFTFFGGTARLPAGTARIELWNRSSGKRLGERAISPHAPSLTTPTAIVKKVGGARTLEVAWNASDVDGDALTHFVHVSSDGVSWSPIGHEMSAPKLSVSLEGLGAGSYQLRALSADGVNLSAAATSFIVP
jgi:hypothetical protein